MIGAIFPGASAGGVHTGIVGMSLHRLLLFAPSHECAERSQACEEDYSGHHGVKVVRLVGPPKQHEHPDVEPERAPDEIASEQVNKCLEPCCYGEAKGEPIEQHDSHQHWRYESHFTDTECCTNDTRRMCRS